MPEQNSFITNVFKTEDETERTRLYTEKWCKLLKKALADTYDPQIHYE